MKNTSEKLVRRCPRLGGPVDFFYCESCEPLRRPCSKIIDCWWETFDVRRYLKDNLAPDVFEKLSHRQPEQKINQLVTLIARTKKRLANP
jgi:hypothetical protein